MPEQEPWRIDKNSPHWQMLNGWLSPFFKEWLKRVSIEHQVSEDELLLGIAETVRKIADRTLALLKEQTGRETAIPVFLITDNPHLDLAVIEAVISLNKRPEILWQRERSVAVLGFLDQLLIATMRFEAAVRELTQNKIVGGTANEFLTFYHDHLVERAIREALKNQKSGFYYELIRIVVEETMHHFDYLVNPLIMKQFTQDLIQAQAGALNFQQKMVIVAVLEERYGLRPRARELFEAIKNQDDLYSPLVERIKKPSN